MIIFAFLRKTRWLEIAKPILLIAFASKCSTLSFDTANLIVFYPIMNFNSDYLE